MSISFDSFSTLSELDIASVALANSAQRADSASRAPSDGKMAPTQTIETVTIVRPLKVTAFICGLIVLLLMSLALASSDWLISDGWRQGLFAHCTEEDAGRPLPFDLPFEPGCHHARDVAYIIVSEALTICCMLLDAFATLWPAWGSGAGTPARRHNGTQRHEATSTEWTPAGSQTTGCFYRQPVTGR